MLKRSLFIVFAALLLTLSMRAQEPVRILFIGNSHTVDATDLLPPMLNGCKVQHIEMTRVYRGSHYLQGWWENFDKPSHASIMTWEPGQLIWRGFLSYDYPLREAVEAGPYDIVVLQETPNLPYAWKWTEQEREAVTGLIGKIRRYSPEAKFYFYLSHCMGKGKKRLIENFDNDNVKQFETVIAENAVHMMDSAEGFGFERMISTGALIQSLRTTSLNQGDRDLLRGDRTHLDYGLSRAAAALLLWKVIFTPLTGITPEETGFRFNEYYPQARRYTTPLTDREFPLVMAAVNAAYEHPMRITDFSSWNETPDFSGVDGVMFLDTENLKVEPVTFPVEFPVGTLATGRPSNTPDTQPYWDPYGVWRSTQQQAWAKWKSFGPRTEETVYKRGFKPAREVEENYSSIIIQGIWKGDYLEFILPVADFKAGTKLRFEAPLSFEKASCAFVLDYLDGGKWRSCATTAPMTFRNGVQSGFLHIRLRCTRAAKSEKNGDRVHLCFYDKTSTSVKFTKE